jgi:hypothetical protein
MFDWLIAAVLLAILVYLIAPQQLPVSLYKLSLVALAAVAGYWIDRSLFPYARPDKFCPTEKISEDENSEDDIYETTLTYPGNPLLASACMLRRAIIVAAAMIAVSLGA